MTKPEIISETPINVVQLKEKLKAVKKRDEELNFRAAKTEEYLAQFITLKPKEAEELFKKLQDLNVPRMRDEHLHKIIDTLPDVAEEVKMVLQGYTITVTKENLGKIADTVKSVAGTD